MRYMCVRSCVHVCVYTYILYKLLLQYQLIALNILAGRQAYRPGHSNNNW